MERRTLGTRGPEVTSFGIGCWAIGGPSYNLGMPTGWSEVSERDAIAGIEVGLTAGVNHFDVADVYGLGRAERLLGRAIRHATRSSIVLSGKVGYFAGTGRNGYEPRQMRTQFETSLDNLCTDYLDVYSFHNLNFGPEDEFLDAAIEQMLGWKRAGLVRAIGMRALHVYTAASSQTRAESPNETFIRYAERIRPDIVQLKFNLLSGNPQARAVARWAEKRGIGLVVNKPLAQGLALNKYDPIRPPQFADGDHRTRKAQFQSGGLAVIRRRLERLLAELGRDSAALPGLALSYARSISPSACVVAGFTRPEQVSINIAGSRSQFSEKELQAVERVMLGIEGELRSVAS
jgi:methylglyoxal reductase